jgi:hypothetical protein
MILQGNQGQTGKQTGQNITVGVGEYSEALVSELQPRYYENAYRGNLFYAVNIAAQALSVASSTYTGLVVQNPAGSGKNLIIQEVIYSPTIAFTAVGAVILGWGGTTSAGVPVALTTGNSSGPAGLSAIVGANSSSVAKVGASCTWAVNGAAAAPTFLRPLFSMQFSGTVASETIAVCKDEVAGSVIVPPGVQIGIEAITTATTGIGYISWIELPL